MASLCWVVILDDGFQRFCDLLITDIVELEMTRVRRMIIGCEILLDLCWVVTLKRFLTCILIEMMYWDFDFGKIWRCMSWIGKLDYSIFE